MPLWTPHLEGITWHSCLDITYFAYILLFNDDADVPGIKAETVRKDGRPGYEPNHLTSYCKAVSSEQVLLACLGHGSIDAHCRLQTARLRT